MAWPGLVITQPLSSVTTKHNFAYSELHVVVFCAIISSVNPIVWSSICLLVWSNNYLLYVSSSSQGDSTYYEYNTANLDVENLLFNSESMDFENLEVVVNDDTTLSSTVVVSSPKHKDFKNYEWS